MFETPSGKQDERAGRRRPDHGSESAAAPRARVHVDGREPRDPLLRSMKRLTSHLYFWVLLAIVAGGTLGYVDPATAVELKPLGDGFIALVKMLISPIIFCTVVLGHRRRRRHEEGRPRRRQGADLFRGRLHVRARHRPRRGQRRPARGRLQRRPGDARRQRGRRLREARRRRRPRPTFILRIIPTTFLDAFTGSGDLLQVLFVAVLFGYAMTHMGARARSVHRFIEACSHIFFAMMNALMKLAPIGAGGAMAFTIGRYGVDALRPLAAADGQLLSDLPAVRAGRARDDRRVHRLQHPALHRLHQGRAADRARHVLVGVGARAADAEAGAAGVFAVGRRPGRAVRLLVQSRWHEHLSDDGGAVRRPGAEHRSHACGSS